jgi:hypothetical protein
MATAYGWGVTGVVTNCAVRDVRISTPGLTGAALAADDGVVHLSAFAV